ncbi:hypothetical protein [Streptomyces fructofermentans]|uniref:Uncharacterized protein n=1 Tax=Streptomyces fructofermentans TaxID=152141 RepID=A0A918NT32_9ACTN|nr:hypothetical protein [Streptomyces fructofermentans]GGX93810.1 hypothetical protein GCM10010515_70790 [Streptomyces fructofermentans]
MGYDTYLVRSPEGEDAAYEAASRAFDAAVEHRDDLDLPYGHPEYQAVQAAVTRAYDAMEAVRTTHFYLTTWAMSECRALMDHFGMLVAVQPPDRPAPEEHGTTAGEAALAPAADDTTPAQVKQYRRALAERLSWAPPQPEGIAAHKLGGDEGWTVTPGEIHAALRAYEASRATNPALLAEVIEDADWWPEWIDYLKHAARHGGFRTYGPSVT